MVKGTSFIGHGGPNLVNCATGQVIDLANGQTMAQVPVTTVAKYACEDAQCCWRLAQVLEARRDWPGAERELRRALEAARKVDAGALARELPQDIPGAIRRARLAAIAAQQPPSGH